MACTAAELGGIGRGRWVTRVDCPLRSTAIHGISRHCEQLRRMLHFAGWVPFGASPSWAGLQIEVDAKRRSMRRKLMWALVVGGMTVGAASYVRTVLATPASGFTSTSLAVGRLGEFDVMHTLVRDDGPATCPPGQPASPRPASFFVPTRDCLGWVPMDHPLASDRPPGRQRERLALYAENQGGLRPLRPEQRVDPRRHRRVAHTPRP